MYSFSKSIVKLFTILLVTVCMVPVASAQFLKPRKTGFEWQFGSGTSLFFGDIGGANRFGTNVKWISGADLSTANLTYMVGLKRNNLGRWSYRSRLLYTKLEGSDFNSKFKGRQLRNLSFVTPILELSLQGEYTIVNLLKNVSNSSTLKLYLFGGAGLTYFNPMAEYRNELVSLRKLGTEGQGLIEGTQFYKPVTMTIPFGGGIKYKYLDGVTLFAEISYHTTFTDYLDDMGGSYYDYNKLREMRGDAAADLSFRGNKENYVNASERGNSKSNDGFASVTLGISKRLGKQHVRNHDHNQFEDSNKF